MRKSTSSLYCAGFLTLQQAEGFVRFIAKKFLVSLTVVRPTTCTGHYLVMRPKPSIRNLDLVVESFNAGLLVGQGLL